MPTPPKVQIKLSRLALASGSVLLAFRHASKPSAVGTNAIGESSPVRGDAKEVRRIVDGGPI